MDLVSAEANVLHKLLDKDHEGAMALLRDFTQRELIEFANACRAGERLADSIYDVHKAAERERPAWYDLQLGSGLGGGYTLLRRDPVDGYVEVASSENRVQIEQLRSTLGLLFSGGMKWPVALECVKADPAMDGVRWWK